MADNVIRMDFDAMAELIAAYKKGHDTLVEVMGEVNAIADLLEDGGLIGDTGDALVAAFRKDLHGSINMLAEKFNDIQDDLNKAVDEMKAADREAGGLYQ